MSNYCNIDDVRMVHGAININMWADLDNFKNPNTINNRISWGNELATAYLNGRLYRGRYDVPFAVGGVPILIKHMTAMFSGILLFDGKRLVSESRDIVLPKRKEFNRLLRQILSGQLKLSHPTSGDIIESSCETAPVVMTSTTLTTSVWNQVCYQVPSAWCGSCLCHTCVCRSLIYPTW